MEAGAEQLLGWLREPGRPRVVPAAALQQALKVSQPTLSRWVRAAGEDVLRIGRGRATGYALPRSVGRAGACWPLHRIAADGRPVTLGVLHALRGESFWFETATVHPVFQHGEFAQGLYPGLPWFLDDQRPQGFLGRSFAVRHAQPLGAPPDLARWQADDILLALLQFGQDSPGDLVLGDTALRHALSQQQAPEAISTGARTTHYPKFAAQVLAGDPIGSSAGGEQPKFALTLDEPGGRWRPVIVKFSEPLSSAASTRWADLLRCEHLAGTVLRAHGLPAAESELLEAGGRLYLQSTRFDRTPTLGRIGVVSLAALDAAFLGHGHRDWWQLAPQLEREGWLSAADAHVLAVIGWFGQLIGNTDMHLGNAALLVHDARPLALAPVYDMLPMRWRPSTSGEVIDRPGWMVTLPLPVERAAWRQAAPVALDFWQHAQADRELTPSFRAIASQAAQAVEATWRRERGAS